MAESGIRPTRGRRDQLQLLAVRDLSVRTADSLSNRTTIGIDNHDGAFADYIAVPQRNLHVVRIRADRRGGLHGTAGRGFQIPAQLSVKRTDRVSC